MHVLSAMRCLSSCLLTPSAPLFLLLASGKEGFKSTTFFNQTVEVVELPKLIDWDLIFLYLLLLAILAVLGEWLEARCMIGMIANKSGSVRRYACLVSPC